MKKPQFAYVPLLWAQSTNFPATPAASFAGPVYRYVEDRWSLKYWEIKMSKEHLDSICFGFEEGDMKAWKVWTVLALVLYYLLRPLLYIAQLRQLHFAIIDLQNLTNIM